MTSWNFPSDLQSWTSLDFEWTNTDGLGGAGCATFTNAGVGGGADMTAPGTVSVADGSPMSFWVRLVGIIDTPEPWVNSRAVVTFGSNVPFTGEPDHLFEWDGSEDYDSGWIRLAFP